MQTYLRKAEEKDISRIAEILIYVKRATYKDIFNDYNVSFNVMQVLSEAETLKQPHGLDNFYVYDDGIVKAVTKFEDLEDKIMVDYLYVDLFFQSEGLGSKIMDYLKSKNKHIELDVLEENLNAIRFYERNEFKYTNYRHEFFDSDHYLLRYAY